MGKSKPKVEVTEYFMSQHFGVCAGPVDALTRIIIKEKEAWAGSFLSETTFEIANDDLFGGVKKEGGVSGTVYYLPGAAGQVLADPLATRLGRSSGLDCPGFRGLTTLFFVGSSRHKGKRGFYWSANSPYLPGVWVTVRRAPVGLDPSIAIIPYPNNDEFPGEFSAASSGTLNDFALFTADGQRLMNMHGTGLQIWSMVSRTILLNVTLPFSTSTKAFALSSDGIFTTADNALQKVSITDGSMVEITDDFDLAATGCSFAGGTLYFYPFTSTHDVGYYNGVRVVGVSTNYVPSHFFTNVEGEGIGLGWVSGDPTIAIAPAGVGTATLIDTTSFGGSTGPAYGFDNGMGSYVVRQDDTFYLIDKLTLTVTDSAAATGGDAYSGMSNTPPGSRTFWNGRRQFRSDDLTLIRTIDRSDWSIALPGGTGEGTNDYYDRRNNAIINGTIGGTPGMVWRLLDRGSGDANPAHIIYECLINTDWGMGSPETLIDFAVFSEVAITLFDEGFGLSMIWTRQASIQDFVQEVLDHIQAVLYVDPTTGLLTLKLIRGDYDPDDLPEINPSNADLTNFGRKLWGEIVNEIVVTWTNPENEQDETVTVQDLASIVTQGGIVSDGRNYYGVRNSILAQKLAQRDLRSAGAPLASCEAEVDRTMWRMRPASVIKVTWPEHGLDGVVMRVTSIDYGRPGEPTIKLSLMEDVFGLDVGDYITPPETIWEDPSSPPEPMEEQRVITLPLFLAAETTSAAFAGDPVYPEVLAGVLATTSIADTFEYELWGEVTLSDASTEWQHLSTNTVLGHAELVADLPAEATSTAVSFTNLIGDTAPVQGGFVFIGDGDDAETEIALITNVGGTFTLSRGVLDTVPRAWPAGTHVWFVDDEAIFDDPTTRSASETVNYKLLSHTSLGLLPIEAAPLLTDTLSDRPWLPNRPANVLAYGVDFSSEDEPIDALARPDPWVTVVWANRNRLMEDGLVIGWSEATVAPEDGQTTTITVLATDGTTVLATHDGLTGETFDVPDASFGSADTVILRVSSERTDADGTFESLQSFDHWVEVGVTPSSSTAGGTGAFSGVSTALAGTSLSASCTGAASLVGAKICEAALGGSGTGDLAAVGGTAAGVTSVGTLFTGTGASGSVSMPTYAAGDLVLVQIHTYNANGTAADTTPPAGWDLITSGHSTSAGLTNIAYGRVMDGSEGSSVTFTWNGGVTNRTTQARAITVSGTVPTSYSEASSTNNGSSSTNGVNNLVSPNTTTLGNNRIVFNFLAAARGTDNTLAETADTWTDAYLNATSLLTPLHIDASVSYKVAPTTGAQGAETRHRTFTTGDASMHWSYLSFAIIMA